MFPKKRIALGLVAVAMSAQAQFVDIVGSTANIPSGSGLAKGNCYVVTAANRTLTQLEFYLSFATTQTLNFYVYTCPTEAGTYTQVWSASLPVTGTGAGWYAAPPVSIALTQNAHYVFAVSWTGSLTYYYGTGDMQATSFGAHLHGHATGTHPLPASITSGGNDQAIYHQRITTVSENLLSVSQSGPGVGDLTMSVALLSPTAFEGWTLLSADTSLPAGAGPLAGILPDALTFEIFFYPYFPGNPFHFHTNDTGFFPLVPFQVGPGALNSLSGLTFDIVLLLFGPGFVYDSTSQPVRYTFQ